MHIPFMVEGNKGSQSDSARSAIAPRRMSRPSDRFSETQKQKSKCLHSISIFFLLEVQRRLATSIDQRCRIVMQSPRHSSTSHGCTPRPETVRRGIFYFYFYFLFSISVSPTLSSAIRVVKFSFFLRANLATCVHHPWTTFSDSKRKQPHSTVFLGASLQAASPCPFQPLASGGWTAALPATEEEEEIELRRFIAQTRAS